MGILRTFWRFFLGCLSTYGNSVCVGGARIYRPPYVCERCEHDCSLYDLIPCADKDGKGKIDGYAYAPGQKYCPRCGEPLSLRGGEE